MPGRLDNRRAGSPGLMAPLALGLAAFLILVILTATANYLAFVPMDGATGAMRIHWPWWRNALVAAGQWAALLPFAFAAFRITAAAPLERSRWARSLLLHVLAVLILAPLHLLLTQGIYLLTNALASSWAEALEIMAQLPFRRILARGLSFPLVYAALSGLGYAWAFRRRERERALRASGLERQLALSQLRMLRTQLNPHFLFNTLNAILSLMRRDTPTAERMTLALTDFLRSALDEDAPLATPLAQELEVAERYLAIEALRFPGRLQVVREVEPPALRAEVPSFLLQPLVENAVRHGLSPRASGGTLWIRGRIEEGCLHLSVEDDGAGSPDPQPFRPGGLGLANTRERLAQHFGPGARFDAGPRPGGGFRVSMRFPVHGKDAPCS